MKVLVVDDDAFSLKLLVSMLQKNDIEVASARSALAAIKHLEGGTLFDVIVSDVMMPHIDGFGLVNHLKADARWGRIPVILCTALGDQESVIKGVKTGAAGYIVKPVKEAVLIAKVTEVVNASPGSILIVDDEKLLRELLTTMLQRECYRVMEAQSAAEALSLIESEKIAAVLADITMPGVDGFELLARIKEKHADMPVVLMSGRTEYTRDDAVGAGANDFIGKPFHSSEVLGRIRSIYRSLGDKRETVTRR